MKFTLSERESELRKAAFEAALLSASFSFEEKWKLAATQNLCALPVEAVYGGPELNVAESALSLEGFSEGCTDGGFTFSLAAHLMAGVIPLQKHASEEMKQHLLPKIVDGDFILANAMTETVSGSAAFALKTTAEAKNGNFVLNGSKTFCTNAPIADGILVYALTDEAKGFFGGISCFLLEKGKHTYKVGPLLEKNGLHHSPLAEIFLDEVIVGKENLIGKTGAGAMIFLESMNWERVCMSAMHVGTMLRLGRNARDYVLERGTAKHQAVQFRLAELFLLAETSWLLAYKAAKLMDEGKDATAAAAQTKIFSSEALQKVAQETLVLFGANGFMKEYGIGETIADAQAALIYSGPNDVLRQLIASRL